MTYKVKITGKGKSLPERRVTSGELEKQMHLPEGFIQEQLGVKQRHWATTETNTSMGTAALREALADAGIKFEMLDLLIYASATYDHPLPASACLLAREMKSESTVPCIDVNSSCLSFITALELASTYIKMGNYSRIAIVSSEIPSKSLNSADVKTMGLFGDAAAAFVVERSEDDAGDIGSFLMRTWPEGAFYTYIPAGGNAMHGIDASLSRELFTFHMKGKEVLIFTMKKMKLFMKEYSSLMKTGLEDVDYIVPHQASRQALEIFTKHYELDAGKVHCTLQKYGNCVAASIPLALYDAIENNKIRRGDKVMLLGSSAGISLAACILDY